MGVHAKAPKGMQGFGPKPQGGAAPKSKPYQKGAKAGSGKGGVSTPQGYRQPHVGKK